MQSRLIGYPGSSGSFNLKTAAIHREYLFLLRFQPEAGEQPEDFRII